MTEKALTQSDLSLKPGVLRTPDERFEDLSEYPFAPHYVSIQSLRMHYVDEGPVDAPPILLLHGEPSWSYVYRKMIPLLRRGSYRVLAPDLIGFGRSDKLSRKRDYSHQMHVDAVTAFIRQVGLNEITLFIQDWGGLIGLRVVAEIPDRFARIVAGNTGLPDASGLMARIAPLLFRIKVWMEGTVTLDDLREDFTLLRWVRYSRTARDFPVGEIAQIATTRELSSDVVAAYDAPFPDERYKAGARIMPSLIPSELVKNHRAWETVLSRWEKPFLTAFSDGDPITRGAEKGFQARIPGTQGQPHVTIEGAGHFLQEDKGEALAQVILDFIESTRTY
jgi:haloalkane dehalogenase